MLETNLKLVQQKCHKSAVDAALGDEDAVGEFSSLADLQVLLYVGLKQAVGKLKFLQSHLKSKTHLPRVKLSFPRAERQIEHKNLVISQPFIMLDIYSSP